MSDNKYLAELDELTNSYLAADKLHLTIKPIDYAPVLHEHQYVGGAAHYSPTKKDIVLPDDTTTPVADRVAAWSVETGQDMADIMWWGVYFNQTNDELYTQANDNALCDDGCVPIGFITLIKPIDRHHTSITDSDEIYTKETKHIEMFLDHTNLARKDRIFEIIIYNQEGNIWSGTRYQPAANAESLNKAVCHLITPSPYW